VSAASVAIDHSSRPLPVIKGAARFEPYVAQMISQFSLLSPVTLNDHRIIILIGDQKSMSCNAHEMNQLCHFDFWWSSRLAGSKTGNKKYSNRSAAQKQQQAASELDRSRSLLGPFLVTVVLPLPGLLIDIHRCSTDIHSHESAQFGAFLRYVRMDDRGCMTQV
jgi:hypothetical protein